MTKHPTNIIFMFLLAFLSGMCSIGHSQTGNDTIIIEPDRLGPENIMPSSDTNQIKVISASRSSKNLEDLPVTIYVISREEIIKNQYYSLTDVLKTLPNIKISRPGSGETGETFLMRGLTGNSYTKILVNGLPVKPTVVSGMPIGNQLPVRQAERIEIIYGPSAAIYGADAVAGVINIITREADKGSFVSGDISLGAEDYTYINFMIGGKAGKNRNILKYSFYGSKTEFNNMNIVDGNESVYNPLHYYQRTGYKFLINGNKYNPLEITEDFLLQNSIDPDTFMVFLYGPGYEGTVTMPDMQRLSSTSHMIGLELKYKGFSIAYNNMYRSMHSSVGLSPVFYKYNDPQNYWGELVHRSVLSYNKEFGKVASTTNISSLIYRMDNNSSLGLTQLYNADKKYIYSASDDFIFEQLVTFPLIKNMELVSGAVLQSSGNLPVTNYLSDPFDKKLYKAYSKEQIQLDTLPGNFGYNPVVFSTFSAFIQSYYMLKRFRFMGGIRHDNNSLYGHNTSPRIAALVKIGKRSSVRSSLGSAYKAPPATVTYRSVAYIPANNPDSIRYIIAPNENLEPERFNTLELGFNTVFFKIFHTDISFYVYNIHNHIVHKKVPSAILDLYKATSDSVLIMTNNRQAMSRVFGSQTTIGVRNIIRPIKLNAELCLSYADRSDEIPDVAEIVKENIKLMPKHQGALKISFTPARNLYVRLEGMWMSKWMRVLIPFEDFYNDLFKNVDGYYALDGIVVFNMSSELRLYFKITNVFDEKYGGINATFLNENLPYNPQLGSNMIIGLNYSLN